MTQRPAQPGSAHSRPDRKRVAQCAGTAAPRSARPRSRWLSSRSSGVAGGGLVTRFGDSPPPQLPVAVSVHQVEPGLAGRRWRSLTLSAAFASPLPPGGGCCPRFAVSAIQSGRSWVLSRCGVARLLRARARLRARFGTDGLEHAALSRSQNTQWVSCRPGSGGGARGRPARRPRLSATEDSRWVKGSLASLGASRP